MTLSVVITIVLAFSTCISPVIVAVINNRHMRKMKKLELAYTESLRKIELNSEIKREIASSDRKLKYASYLNFIQAASEYMLDNKNPIIYSKLISSYSECIMNGISWGDLDGYMQYVNPVESAQTLTENNLKQMSYFLSDIAEKFNKMLKHDLDQITLE